MKPPRKLLRRSNRIRAKHRQSSETSLINDHQSVSPFSSLPSDLVIFILEYIDAQKVCILRRLSSLLDNLCWLSLQRPRVIVFHKKLRAHSRRKLFELCPKAIRFRSPYSKLENYYIQTGFAVKATDAKLAINRRWFAFEKNDHLRSLHIEAQSTELIGSVLPKFSNLQSIELSFTELQFKDLSPNFDCLKHCPQLRSFNFRIVYWFMTPDEAFAMFKTLPTSLLALRFMGPNMYDHLELISQQFPQLQILTISSAPSMSSEGHHPLLKVFPNLTEFKSDPDIISFHPGDLPNLKSLQMRSLETWTAEKGIKKCENLRLLEVCDARARYPNISRIPSMFRLRHLSGLSLYKYTFDVHCIDSLSLLRSLRSLCLSDCRFPTSRWFDFGAALAQTPLDRLQLVEHYSPTIRRDQLEDLLETLRLRFLWISSKEVHPTLEDWHPDATNPKVFLTGRLPMAGRRMN